MQVRYTQYGLHQTTLNALRHETRGANQQCTEVQVRNLASLSRDVLLLLVVCDCPSTRSTEKSKRLHLFSTPPGHFLFPEEIKSLGSHHLPFPYFLATQTDSPPSLPASLFLQRPFHLLSLSSHNKLSTSHSHCLLIFSTERPIFFLLFFLLFS